VLGFKSIWDSKIKTIYFFAEQGELHSAVSCKTMEGKIRVQCNMPKNAPDGGH
jgi:hypothetical protein